jgi:hypothetical protein
MNDMCEAIEDFDEVEKLGWVKNESAKMCIWCVGW